MKKPENTVAAPAPALPAHLGGDDRVIWRADLCALFGVGSEAVRRWIKSGKLPPPDVAISRRTMGWRLSSLRAAGLGLL